MWKKNKVNIVHGVIEGLDKVLSLNDEGSVSVRMGSGLESASEIIASVFSFRRTVSERKRIDLAQRAIIDSYKASALSIDHLEKALKAGQSRFLAERPKTFVLVTCLSLDRLTKLKSRRLPHGQLSLRVRRPSQLSHLPSVATQARQFGFSYPDDYKWVVVTVSARDPVDAGNDALIQLDYWRAVLNLSLHFGRSRITMGKPPPPVNSVRIGPIHTLHDSNGQLVSPEYWWEPNYKRIAPITLSTSQLEQLTRIERIVGRRVMKWKSGDTLRDILIQYVRALDDPDLNGAFLKLWSVLERLTDTTTKSYDVTIQRTAGLYKDQKFYALILDNLRRSRNQLVHHGREHQDPERPLYDLKAHVEILIQTLVTHALELASMEEFGSLLDLMRLRGKTLVRKRAMAQIAHRATGGGA